MKKILSFVMLSLVATSAFASANGLTKHPWCQLGGYPNLKQEKVIFHADGSYQIELKHVITGNSYPTRSGTWTAGADELLMISIPEGDQSKYKYVIVMPTASSNLEKLALVDIGDTSTAGDSVTLNSDCQY